MENKQSNFDALTEGLKGFTTDTELLQALLDGTIQKGSSDYYYWLNVFRCAQTIEQSGVHWLPTCYLATDSQNLIKNYIGNVHGCDACKRNALFLSKFISKDGTPLFLENKDNYPDVSIYAEVSKILSEKVKLSSDAIQEIEAIGKNTFASLNTDGHLKFDGVICCHYSFVPDNVTNEVLLRKFNSLNQDFIVIHQRLQKFLEPGFVDDISLMEKALDKCVRPDHWRGVINWVKGIQEESRNRTWSQLSWIEKTNLRICAIMTGRSEHGVHFDYKQSSNLLDFSEKAISLEALSLMMDERSNPATYMVSQLATKLQQHNVTSKYGVGLLWNTKDDLDIRVICPDGSILYYGNKKNKFAELDFDANAMCKKCEANPCENISFLQPGKFIIEVNNYQWHTAKCNIPFTIIIRGYDGIKEIEGVWPKDRSCGKFMEITQYTHVIPVEEPITISTTQARKFTATEQEFMDRFGDPFSYVATLEDIPHECIVWEYKNVNSVIPNNETTVNGFVNSLVSNALNPTLTDTVIKTKTSLFERIASNPTTIDGLIKLLETGYHTLTVNPRNCVPGYMTKIITPTNVRKYDTNISMCSFNKKFEHPLKPNSDAEFMTARMSDSWFKNGLNTQVNILAIVKFAEKYFFVLEGSQLPRNNSDWPLSSGMYPTDLSVENHIHRSRWATHNIVIPKEPENNGTQLIGTFLLSKFDLNLDGREIHLS